MRIGIISLQHESNTFIRTSTGLDMFRCGTLLTGSAIEDEFADGHHEVSGFLQGLHEAGAETAAIFGAWALPSGTITAETYQRLEQMMFESLERVGTVDGLLVAPHGAAVSASYRDMDGHWLTLLRQRVGSRVPIVCTLDPHANLSKRMIEACDATIAYRTNPHLDQRQVGLKAAQLLLATLRGEVSPTQAAAFTPVVINIEKQETAAAPCRPMYELADRLLEREGVLSNSIVLGFPYADVVEMGASFVVVTNGDQAAAQSMANELASYLWAHREAYRPQLIDIEPAIETAQDLDPPVCLLDMGDNVGGGSAADGTAIACAVQRRGGPKTFVSINDPQSAQAAVLAGIDSRPKLEVGGKTDDLHGPPLKVTAAVRSIHDGIFTETRARHGGRSRYDMGLTVMVETESGLTVQITSNRIAPFSLNQITSCGLDPGSFQILVAKGVVAPVAAYAQVCRQFIRVNTPGVTTADIETLPYRYRRKPLFPFEP